MRAKQNTGQGGQTKAAELPRVLYVAATYKKRESSHSEIRYLVATPSAEMVQRLKAQIALANLGEI